MADTIASAQVVAVGTLEDGPGDTVLFAVEESFKGAAAGDRLSINNATNLDCYEAVEPGRENYRAGDRVLAFLEPDTLGVADYKVHRFGWDIFAVDGDVLHPYVEEWRLPLPRIVDVRRHFAEAATAEFDPALESAPPCNPPYGLAPTAIEAVERMAEAILIGTVTGIDGAGTRVRVDESFKGAIEGEFVANDHYFSLDGRCELTMDAARNALPVGTRVAMLLVRDESGTAEWRPAAWGVGAWTINDTAVVRYEGIPLLGEVRARAEEVVGAVPGGAVTPVDLDGPSEEEVLAEADPGSRARFWLTGAAIAIMGVAAAGMAAAFVARRRA
jgi:hypothetical protein